MVQVVNTGFGAGLGSGLSQGLSKGFDALLQQKLQQKLLGQQQQQAEQNQMLQQREQLEQAKASLKLAQQLGTVDPNIDVDDVFQQLGSISPQAVQQQIGLASKQQEQQQKSAKEKRESELLAKVSRGEELTPQEQAELSPTTQRSLIQAQKPVFESEAQKIEAKRVAEIASDITKEAGAIEVENSRLDRMEKLSEKGELSTPLMVKTLDKIGLPLSILGNPDTEEFAKLEADFVRDVSKVFPGQIRVYEIQAYMKTIPGLLNSAEGREAIIRNRRLLNEMKQVRFDALKDILKENKGQRPPNLDILIEERVGKKQAELANKFREGITEDVEEYQPILRMVDDQGSVYEIPSHLVPQASKQGLKFQ